MRKIAIIAAATILLSAGNSYGQAKWARSEGHTLTLTANGEQLGMLSTMEPEDVKASYTIQQVDLTTWKVSCTFKAKKDIDNARLTVDFTVPRKASWWMIPSVSYNGNKWGRGNEPKGARATASQGASNTDWWTFSYRRTPIPGAIYSEDEKAAVATWSTTPKNEDDAFSCSIMPTETQTVHKLIWPEEEMPLCYCARDKYRDGFRKAATMKQGEKRTMTIYISAVPTEPDHKAIRSFLTTCWNTIPKPEVPEVSADTVWKRSIYFFKHSLWAEEGPYTGFSIGLLPSKDGGWHQRGGGKYESGWCGQNISLAISMLADYQRTGQPSSLEKGMRTLDCWAKYCPLENGLFLVHFDDVLKPNPNTIIDACNLGTTALNYFEAYHVAKECEYNRPNYIDIALKACDFVLNDQREDGCYARGWYMDGRSYVREGTIGCFMVPAMIAAWKQTKDEKYLTSARKAYDYYMGELLRDGYTTAGALDTWCIDKESSITLLRSSIRLYEATGEKRYLEDAETVSYYLSTWLWHYDAVYPENDNLTVYGWHSFGATAVSVQHHHLDYYAVYWVPEWVKLSELTGDPQWREKAKAIWDNTCQLISDGKLEINGRVRPRGSQNEAYFECSWGFDDNPDRLNNWLVAWPGAFRLETLRSIPQGL